MIIKILARFSDATLTSGLHLQLKKRQQKKKAVGDGAAVSVGSPLSGIISPSPPGSVFSGGASEAGDVASEFGEIGSVPHERL